MRAAVIDIGSNSIKLIIGQPQGDEIQTIEVIKNVIPIGRSTFFTGRISQNLINQTVELLTRYKDVLKQYEVTEVKVIATTAVREAENKDIFLDTISRKTGLAIEVLTVGDVIFYLDSYLSHKLKSKYPVHEKNLIIAELGAGSLDISVLKKGFTVFDIGLPVGTLRLKQLIGKLDSSLMETSEAVREYIESEFDEFKRSMPRIHIDDVMLIDETYSFYLQDILTRKKPDTELLKITSRDSKEFLSKLEHKTAEEIADLYKIPLEIADLIGPYAVILDSFFQITRNRQLYILETSLSEAVLANKLLEVEFAKKYNKTNQLISVANHICSKYAIDIKHTQEVVRLSQMLFDALRVQLGLKEQESLYLILAAYLHDIGMFIHNRSHHKHTEYIINSISLFRLTDEEVKIIGCVARYHRSRDPQPTHPYYSSLPVDKQVLVQKLSAILKIANALDTTHRQKIRALEVSRADNGDLTLTVATTKNFLLEKVNFLEKKSLFEEITGNELRLVIKS